MRRLGVRLIWSSDSLDEIQLKTIKIDRSGIIQNKFRQYEETSINMSVEHCVRFAGVPVCWCPCSVVVSCASEPSPDEVQC